MFREESQDKQNECCGELLGSNADANRHVAATFLVVGNVGVGIDFETAFYGRVLVNKEGHAFWAARFLLKLLSWSDGLARCPIESKRVFCSLGYFSGYRF